MSHLPYDDEEQASRSWRETPPAASKPPAPQPNPAPKVDEPFLVEDFRGHAVAWDIR